MGRVCRLSGWVSVGQVQYLEEGPGQGIERLVVQEADQQPQDGSGCRGVLQVKCELKGGAQSLNLWVEKALSA